MKEFCLKLFFPPVISVFFFLESTVLQIFTSKFIIEEHLVIPSILLSPTTYKDVSNTGPDC